MCATKNQHDGSLGVGSRNQLLLMTEAATLLVMDKAIFAKPQAVRRQFVELSGQQLRALLFNFRPDPCASPLSSSLGGLFTLVFVVSDTVWLPAELQRSGGTPPG